MAKDNIPASPIYGYLRQWFDFAFEHQGLVTGNHTAIYCWFIEQNNRLGWAKEFGAPRDQTMAAAGISSYNTYKKCFNDLINWGFVKLVKPSKNQYFANVIALSKFDKAKYKALDKALLSHLTKQSESTVQGTVALNIPIDNYTNIPLNHIVVVEYAQAFNFFIETKNFRMLREKYKLDEDSIKKFFERFYNEKVDLGDFNNKTKSDLVKHFTAWLPMIIKIDEKNKTEKNGNIFDTAKSTAERVWERKYGTPFGSKE